MAEESRLATALFPHANEKGGQEEVDREKINAIVLEVTKESEYTREKLDHHAEAESWVQATRERIALVDRSRMSVLRHTVKERESKLLEEESKIQRVEGCSTATVIDFDMFYAAVEIRDAPELATKPIAIGGIGMISTTNYVARKWGVRSAMPGFVGQELCRRGPEFGMPATELVFVKPNYAKYEQVAAIAREIYKEYDPNFRTYSLDEAYLDLSDAIRSKRQQDTMYTTDSTIEEDILNEIRARVYHATGGLTTSAGLGPNFRLAKIAADQNKPNGQFRIGPSRTQVLEFLHSLPCRKVGGIGRVLEHKLRAALGISTCGDLRDNLPYIYHCCTPKQAHFLHQVALGIQISQEEQNQSMSIGNERTFAAISILSELRSKLWDLSEMVASRIADHPAGRPRKCALKLKHADFKVFTRTAAEVAPVLTAHTIFARLEPLLDAHLRASPATKIRLMGVRTFDFEKEKEYLADTASRPRGQPAIDTAFRNLAAKANTKSTELSEWQPPTADDIDTSVLAELPSDLRVHLEAQIKATTKRPLSPQLVAADNQKPPSKNDFFKKRPRPNPASSATRIEQKQKHLSARLMEMGFSSESVASLFAQERGRRLLVSSSSADSNKSDPFPALVEELLHIASS